MSKKVIIILVALAFIGGPMMVNLALAAANPHVAEAIEHANEAVMHGKEGHAKEVVKHAQGALKHAQAAQKDMKNPHLDEGVKHLKEAIEHGKAGHADVATSLVFLGRLLCARESGAEALRVFEEAIAAFEGALGPRHWRLANARSHYGECLTSARKYAEAESQLRAALEVLEPDEDRFEEALSRTREGLARLEALRAGPEVAEK